MAEKYDIGSLKVLGTASDGDEAPELAHIEVPTKDESDAQSQISSELLVSPRLVLRFILGILTSHRCTRSSRSTSVLTRLAGPANTAITGDLMSSTETRVSTQPSRSTTLLYRRLSQTG